MLRFSGEIQILSLLARNRNRVVNYGQFQEYAWDSLNVDLPTMRTEINRLKKILKEDIIINVRNLGYIIKRPT